MDEWELEVTFLHDLVVFRLLFGLDRDRVVVKQVQGLVLSTEVHGRRHLRIEQLLVLHLLLLHLLGFPQLLELHIALDRPVQDFIQRFLRFGLGDELLDHEVLFQEFFHFHVSPVLVVFRKLVE